MKFLKNIALSLFIAASTLGISSVAVADYTTDSIDKVSVEVADAAKAIDDKSSKEDVIVLIKKAAKSVKEIPQGDNIDIKRQRANAHLKKARLAAKKGKLDDAKAHLAKAAEGFAKLRAQF